MLLAVRVCGRIGFELTVTVHAISITCELKDRFPDSEPSVSIINTVHLDEGYGNTELINFSVCTRNLSEAAEASTES